MALWQAAWIVIAFAYHLRMAVCVCVCACQALPAICTFSGHFKYRMFYSCFGFGMESQFVHNNSNSIEKWVKSIDLFCSISWFMFHKTAIGSEGESRAYQIRSNFYEILKIQKRRWNFLASNMRLIRNLLWQKMFVCETFCVKPVFALPRSL